LCERLSLLKMRRFARQLCDVLYLGTGTATRLCAALIVGSLCFGVLLCAAAALGLTVGAVLVLAIAVFGFVTLPLAVLVLGPTDNQVALAIRSGGMKAAATLSAGNDASKQPPERATEPTPRIPPLPASRTEPTNPTDVPAVGPAIISLKCPSCGGGLAVRRQDDVLSCRYCGGTAQVVHHGGQPVSLAPVLAALSRVQLSTDRTAAELAVRRLKEDLAAVDDQLDQLHHRERRAGSGVMGAFALGGMSLVLRNGLEARLPANLCLGLAVFVTGRILFGFAAIGRQKTPLRLRRAKLVQKLGEHLLNLDE
jgi:hypothetical protein